MAVSDISIIDTTTKLLFEEAPEAQKMAIGRMRRKNLSERKYKNVPRPVSLTVY